MNKQQVKDRILYLDILRVMAILAVIVIHVTAMDVIKVENIGRFDWWVSNIFNSISRWGVPVFFMISGVLLLDDSKESTSEFLKKRVGKIGIPLIIWSIIYSIAKHYFIEMDMPEILSYPKILLTDIIYDRAYYHLWFIYVIITIYLVTPFLRKIIKHSSTKEIRYWLILWLISTIGSYTYKIIYYCIQHEQPSYIRILDVPMVGGFIGYFVLGYYLNKIEIGKKIRRIIYLISILSFILVPILIYLTSIGDNKLNEQFYNHFVITTFFISVGVFIFFKYNDLNNIIPINMKKIIVSMSNATFGIYIVHMLVLINIANDIVPKGMNTIIRIIGRVGLTYIISYLIVKLGRLNKHIKKYLLP
ncbi:acyltransferase family protein [Vallitalea sediminicola]